MDKKHMPIKPYLLIWLTIPAVWLLPLIYAHHLFDVQLHDTYLVLAPTALALAVTILIGGMGLVYALFSSSGHYLNWPLSVSHAAVLLTMIILLGILMYYMPTVTNRSAEEMMTNTRSFNRLNLLFMLELMLLVSSIIIFIINLVIGVANSMAARR